MQSYTLHSQLLSEVCRISRTTDALFHFHSPHPFCHKFAALIYLHVDPPHYLCISSSSYEKLKNLMYQIAMNDNLPIRIFTNLSILRSNSTNTFRS